MVWNTDKGTQSGLNTSDHGVLFCSKLGRVFGATEEGMERWGREKYRGK